MGIFDRIFKKGYSQDTHLIDPKNPEAFRRWQTLGFGRKKWKWYSDEELVRMGYAVSSDVYAITHHVSTKTSHIPIKCVTESSKGLIESENNLLYELYLDDQKQIKNSILYQSTLNYKLTGDIFIEYMVGAGFSEPTSIKIHRSASVIINPYKPNSTEVKNYEVYENGKKRKVEPEFMLHIKNYDPTLHGDLSLRGISPLQAAYATMFASSEVKTAMGSMYKNQGVSGIISDRSERIQEEDEALRIQKAINDRLGGSEKGGHFHVATGDYQVQMLGMSSKDLEMIKSQPLLFVQLCRVYSVPPRLLGASEGASWNNKSLDLQTYYNDAVQPDLELQLEEINRFTSKFESGYKLIPDYSKIEPLFKDKKTEAEKNKINSDGVVSVLSNELLSDKQKITILVQEWKKTEEEAKELLKK